jgi:5-methylcytosine-specific restriction protein A
MRSGSKEERKFHQQRVKNGKVFVALDVEGDLLFAPSKFAGYRANFLHHSDRLSERHGSDTNGRIRQLLGGEVGPVHPDHTRLEGAYEHYCREGGFYPSLHPRARRYWIVRERSIYPDDLPDGETHLEGARKTVSVNRYERDPTARRKCLAYHGFTCSVCAFDFEETYGELGQNYIHVHHLTPISTIRTEYEIDPVAELRPVCPNCHAMLHRTEPCLTIEELRTMLQNENSGPGNNKRSV